MFTLICICNLGGLKEGVDKPLPQRTETIYNLCLPICQIKNDYPLSIEDNHFLRSLVCRLDIEKCGRIFIMENERSWKMKGHGEDGRAFKKFFNMQPVIVDP